MNYPARNGAWLYNGMGQNDAEERGAFAMPVTVPTATPAAPSSIFSTITQGISDIVTAFVSPQNVTQVMNRVIFGQPSGVAPTVAARPMPAPGIVSGLSAVPTWVYLAAGVGVVLMMTGKKRRK